MFPKRILIYLSAAVMLAALISGCDVLPQNPNVSDEPTTTPTATLDPSGFQAVVPRACPAGDWQTIQSERRAVGQVHWQQGSLMAWQPSGEAPVDLGSSSRGSGTKVAGKQATSGAPGLSGTDSPPVSAVKTTTPTSAVPLLTAAVSTPSASTGTPSPSSTRPVDDGEGAQFGADDNCSSNGGSAPNCGVRFTTPTPTLPPAITPSSTPRPPKQAPAAPQRLAYLIPAERTSWFAGTLMIATFGGAATIGGATSPDFADRRELAPNTLVSGDLTWSPAGTWLAFLAFRPTEGLYTIMAVRADGSGLTDLFPADQARTDARTSQKAILGWKDDSTVQVIVSCGEECRSAFDISLGGSSAPELIPTPIDNYHTLENSLAITRHTMPFDPTAFPKNMLDQANKNDPLVMKSQPNWSPDETMVDYLDKKGILWLLSIPDKINYPLDIGLRDVIETEWSADSGYIAVRAEDRIFIFQIPCGKK